MAASSSGGMLLGVITAIMFSFADEEGPLTRRFTALGRSAAGIALGGIMGHLLGGYGAVFWLLFVAAAFGAAWLNRAGKSAHIGARLAVMALAIAAGTPEHIVDRGARSLVGSLAVTVLVRLADHAVFGPLPAGVAAAAAGGAGKRPVLAPLRRGLCGAPRRSGFGSA